MKPVGERSAGNPHATFDERGGETECCHRPKPPRLSSTLLSSAALDIDRLADATRGHWGVESMHWLLDVQFKDDLSRYRSGNGAKNMAVVRRFALNLVRANKSKLSVKTRRKSASWNPTYLLELLQLK